MCHCLSLNEKEFCLRKNRHECLEKEAERAFQGKCAAQRRLSLRWTDEVGKEEILKLESQRLELYHAIHWAEQAQIENSRLYGELNTRSTIYQERRAKYCQELENYEEFAANKRMEPDN